MNGLKRQYTSAYSAPRVYTKFMAWTLSRLIVASSTEDDPANLLIAAGRNYVPIDHSVALDTKALEELPTTRPTIDQIVSDIMNSVWYKDQIIYRRLIDAKEAQTGRGCLR